MRPWLIALVALALPILTPRAAPAERASPASDPEFSAEDLELLSELELLLDWEMLRDFDPANGVPLPLDVPAESSTPQREEER